MSESEELEQAMAALEKQRTALGDAAVEAALAGLQQKLAALDGRESVSPEQKITRFMPKALADKMRAARHIEGERKQVTVLFADLSGYTSLSERLDPEVVMDLSQDLLRELAEAVYEREGYVAQFMGDAVMAVFGAPLTHEDDPTRALYAAFAMRERIENLNRRWMERLGQPLSLHIGINTGTAVTGSVGSDLRMDYAVIGDTTNTAQRLQSAAQRGEILVSRDTYRLTRDAFTFVELEPIIMKGKREPVLAYRVTGIKPRLGRGRGLEQQGLSSPFVGRDQELNAIKSPIDRVSQNSEGGIVGVIGEAGLGKTRLVSEAKAFAFARNVNVLWMEGQMLSFGQTISYYPFQQILRGWANIREDDTEAEAWNKLEQRVRDLFGQETIDYLPYLASMLALEVQGEYAERVKYLDGDAMGKQIFLTSRRFFDRLARTQPTVLVFEDLHWMDESSTHLLEHLLPLTETAPLLIVGLSRPERDTPAARVRELCARDYAARYTEIRLAPLSDSDSAQLIQNVLEIENLPPRLRELIVQKADGNPFFLEEVIRTLMSTGVIARDASSGRWRITAQIETIQIPDTIQGVIMARVDRLDEEVKRVLRVAAVIGRSFLYRVLNAIAEAGQQLDNDLTELQATELIREKQRLPELEFMFKHALAQEATYESILLQKRRELHARVARAIEQLFAGRLEEFYGLLAYHYARAEVWDKAQEYLLKAADQAGQLAGDAEALNLYEQAVVAYGRAFGDKWDPIQRASLERKVGEALSRRGEYPLALEHFGRGLSYLGYRLPISRWQVRRALLRELIVQVGHRFRHGSFTSVAKAASPSIEDEIFIYRYMGYIDAVTNSERFLLLTLRLLNLSERHGYVLGVVMGSYGLGVAFDYLSLFRLAESYHRSGADAAEKLRQSYAIGHAYSGLTTHEFYSGKTAQALEYSRRSTQGFREAGDLEAMGLPISCAAWLYGYRGELAEALAVSNELVRMGQDAGALALCCWGETVLGYVLRRKGQLQEAIACQQKALELARAIPDIVHQIIGGADLGACYLQQGNWQAALSELEQCRRVAAVNRVFEPSGLTTTLNNIAEAYLFAVEHVETSERTSHLNNARRACQAATKAMAKCPLHSPHAMRLQGTYEWLTGKRAAAQQWWLRSLAEAERMGLGYDVGMTHLEMGQRLGERELLEKAATIFSEIGAELDLARTRELLGR